MEHIFCPTVHHRPYYGIDELPIGEEDKQEGNCLFGHMLLMNMRNGSEVEGIVNLYNRFATALASLSKLELRLSRAAGASSAAGMSEQL